MTRNIKEHLQFT